MQISELENRGGRSNQEGMKKDRIHKLAKNGDRALTR